MPLSISKRPASDVLVGLDLVQVTAVDELPDHVSPRSQVIARSRFQIPK